MNKSDDLLERIRASEDHGPEPSIESLAKRELAAQLRALSHAIARTGASPLQMREVAAELRTQCEILAAASRSTETPTADASEVIPGMQDFRDRSPITGQSNPTAPPAALAADLEAEIIAGEVTFGLAFEGAPGCVHGGFVAAVLDEALGMACIFSGVPGMTAELTTRYRHHTPISTPLRVEARLVSVEGRKIRTSGEVYHDDRVVAEGSGLFIAVDAEKFGRLLAARSQREPAEETS